MDLATIYLPVAPLRRAVLDWAEAHPPLFGGNGVRRGGLNELGRAYAGRSGQRLHSASRQVRRIALAESPRVSILVADRLCAAMGLHPTEVYGGSWWRAATRSGRVVDGTS